MYQLLLTNLRFYVCIFWTFLLSIHRIIWWSLLLLVESFWSLVTGTENCSLFPFNFQISLDRVITFLMSSNDLKVHLWDLLQNSIVILIRILEEYCEHSVSVSMLARIVDMMPEFFQEFIKKTLSTSATSWDQTFNLRGLNEVQIFE